MNEIIIGIAIVLVLAILFLIFRIQTMVSVMRGTYQQRVGKSNGINALMLLISMIVGFAAFFWYSGEVTTHYLPRASSEHGLATDRMFWITMGILTFAFVVTNILLFWFAYKYQYREDRKAYFYPENHKLEVIWTTIPAIVMAILVYYGWQEWSKITQPEPPESEVVEIMGRQFNWHVRYPGKDGELGNYHYKLIDATNEMGLDIEDPRNMDDFLPTEIHIPKGRPVLFRIRARDVLHSVYAPHFRLKMDAVPGMPTKFWFKPLKTTQEMRDELGNPSFNYELACAEICGRGHFAMRFIIVVDEPDEYERWFRSQRLWSDLNKDYIQEKLAEKKGKAIQPMPAAPAEAQTTEAGVSLNINE